MTKTVTRSVTTKTRSKCVDFKFVVDCKSSKYCRDIRAHMKEQGFHVAKNNTSLGDHYGVKLFSSQHNANRAAEDIFKIFSKKMIRQIAVYPLSEI